MLCDGLCNALTSEITRRRSEKKEEAVSHLKMNTTVKLVSDI